MSEILNINVSNNMDKRKLRSKLSFKVGEKISARIINVDESKKSIELKLSDGWQFSAEVEEALELTSNESVERFEVTGYKNGKLQIKLIKKDEADSKNKNSSLQNFIEDKLLVKDKKNLEMLLKMVKHNIPLDRENVAKIKNIIDFQSRIIMNQDEMDKFIDKYLISKKILQSSEEGIKISNILKNFFNELKNVDIDTLMTFMENDIDFTEENIKSFNRIFKESTTIYNDLKEVEINKNEFIDKYVLKYKNDNLLKNEDENVIIKNENKVKIDNNINKDNIIDLDKENISSKEIINSQNDIKTDSRYIKGTQQYAKSNNTDSDTIFKEIFKSIGIECGEENQEIIKEVKNILVNNANEISELNERIQKNLNENKLTNEQPTKDEIDTKQLNTKEINEKEPSKTSGYEKDMKLSNETSLDNKENNNSIDLNRNNTEFNKMKTHLLVKNELASKIEEMKTIIKSFMQDNLEIDTDKYNKVIENLNEKMNNFKVFNSVSNQYYYLDIPVNVQDNEYPCKLIIKDDRKKGKKIDSKNVKIVTSIKTLNMDTIDAYLKANNNDLNINIKCDKKWIKLIDISKEKLLKDLSSSKYNVSVKVEEREKEANLINCREFFQDKNLGMVDVRV